MHIQLLVDDDPVGLLRDADVEKFMSEAHISVTLNFLLNKFFTWIRASSFSDAMRISSMNTAISTLEER
jgi:hypothetical protein